MNAVLFFVLLFLPFSFASAGQVFYASGPTGAKRIALTFDDGPGPQTKEFLALLDRYHVKATFFVLGDCAQTRPVVVKDEVERGHEVGSHTYSHVNYHKRRKELVAADGSESTGEAHAKDQLLADMKKADAAIRKATGKPVTICRMPNGVSGRWVNEIGAKMGYTMVNWTFGADWTPTDEGTLKQRYLAAIKPGAILLLHDGGAHREKTLAITEAVLQAATEKGYEVVTISDLLHLASHEKLSHD